MRGPEAEKERRESDCVCAHTGHTRKVDPHNDLVTNCLDRKYYRREPLAGERMPGPLHAVPFRRASSLNLCTGGGGGGWGRSGPRETVPFSFG